MDSFRLAVSAVRTGLRRWGRGGLGRGRRNAAAGLDAQLFQFFHDLAFAFQEQLGLLRVKIAHERDEFAHVGLFLVADVRQDGLRDRVVGGQVVRFVQVDGFKLAGDVQAERLHEFLVGHLAIDVAGERIGKAGHGVPLFQRAVPCGRRRGCAIGRMKKRRFPCVSVPYDTPLINVLSGGNQFIENDSQ